MWGLLLALAIMFAVNPVLLAVIVLMISRPRPVQNLAAYWVGSMITSLLGLLIPLLLLHSTPAFRTYSESFGTSGKSPAARIIQLTMGVLMLAAVAVMLVRSARQRARQPILVGNASGPVPDSDTPNPIASPFGNVRHEAGDNSSAFRRLLGRLQTAWEDGALWVSFVFGLGGLPPPMLVLFVLTPIVASGSPIGTQVLAVILFVIAMFVVVEITLVSYLITPARTLAVLSPMHDWAQAHRRHILITIFSVVGTIQVVNGIV